MKITREEILHIAALGRLTLDEAQILEMGEHLDNVLERFRTLDGVDVSDVPPTAHILPYVNVLRDDVVEPPMDRDKLMQNAPETDGSAYIVPRVVE